MYCLSHIFKLELWKKINIGLMLRVMGYYSDPRSDHYSELHWFLKFQISILMLCAFFVFRFFSIILNWFLNIWNISSQVFFYRDQEILPHIVLPNHFHLIHFWKFAQFVCWPLTRTKIIWIFLQHYKLPCREPHCNISCGTFIERLKLSNMVKLSGS